MTKNDLVVEIIYPTLEACIGEDVDITPADPIFGEHGLLDSVGLLRFVVLLEEKIFESTGKAIRLVTAEAMSQKRSPFRTADSLGDYISERLA